MDIGEVVPFAIIDLDKKWYGEVALSAPISGRVVVVRLNPGRNAHSQHSIDVRCVALCGFRSGDAATWKMRTTPAPGIDGRLPEPTGNGGQVGWWLGLPVLAPGPLPAVSASPAGVITGLPAPLQ